MNINQLNQDDRKRIRLNENKIKTLSSTELLEYSKSLQGLKDDLGTNVSDYLFIAIDRRIDVINSNSEQRQENKNQKMIREFKRRAK